MIKIIPSKTAAEAGVNAADVICGVLKNKPNMVLGLATGSSPVGMYKELIRRCEKGEVSFKDVRTVNLDEYVGLPADHDQSYRYFMNDNLFDHINIDKERTNVLYGLAEDPDKECERYEQLIKDLGGIDIQVLGIGQNGHIAFNEPEENLYLNTHKTALTESTIQANSRFFSEGEIMPTASLTMGMGTIFAAKKIILLINGKSKKAAFEQLLNDRFSTSCPATILKLHPDVTVICDAEVEG